MKKRILVKVNDYKRYTEKYLTSKIDDKNEIITYGGFPKFMEIHEEIFEGRETEYEIIKNEIPHILIKFKSKSNTEYRLDLLKDRTEEVYHLAFSLYDSDLDPRYHDVTDKEESIDVFSRTIWILKDLNKEFEYCIGATGDERKDRIYEYMMRFVSNWEKRETNQYNLGWAIYFKI
jgi:hypothetical protein